jgi:YggT family protein
MNNFIITFIQLLFDVLWILILVRVLMSWIDPTGTRFGQFSRILHELTEPILAPIRSIMPSMGGLDFSPIITLILLQAIQMALLQALR